MSKNSIQRFREIVKVLGFYGITHILDRRIHKRDNAAVNLRKAFEELGPTFIKIGQILSTRSDMFPEKYIIELSKLQDNVAPEKFEAINKVFYSEFSCSIEDAFLYFEKFPLASGSIAQVHRAILKNNQEVIVKVQRPGIYEKMKLDLSILHRIIRMTKARLEDAPLDPKEVLDEILSSTEQELNFENEAKNMDKFKSLNHDVSFIYSPEVIWDLTCSKVITMEKIDGYKIDNKEQLISLGYDIEDIGKKLTLAYCKQIFEDGFFHGDPHPGNILVLDRKICFIDFGIMGSISKTMKSILNDIIFAVADKNINQTISALLAIGLKQGPIDRNSLYEDIDYMFANYLSIPLENIKVSLLLQEIMQISKRNQIRLPKEFTLLIKSLVIIEGVITKISPEIKVLDIIVPYVRSYNKEYIFNRFELQELLFHSYHFLRDAIKLPSKMVELSDSILAGRSKIQFQINQLDRPIDALNKMVNRIVSGLIISAMILASTVMLDKDIGPTIYGVSFIGLIATTISAIAALALLFFIIRSGKM